MKVLCPSIIHRMKSIMRSFWARAAAERRGFTLIELLVVIAIIGILSSVVLASLNSARQKGRDARRVSDLKQLQLALELAYDKDGTYPASSGAFATDLAGVVSDGYISVLPTDPGDGEYGYIQTESGSAYCLGATLETTGQTNILANDNDSCGGTTAIIGTDTCATLAGDADDEAIYCVTP